MAEVEISNDTRTKLPEARLKRFALRVMALIPEVRNAAMEIAFVGETRIRKLNAQYRSKDEVTDVLSFRLDDPGAVPVGPFGSVVICVKRAEENARSAGVQLVDMLEELILHSILHLTGSDHESAAGHRNMEQRRKRIIAKM